MIRRLAHNGDLAVAKILERIFRTRRQLQGLGELSRLHISELSTRSTESLSPTELSL